MLTFEELTNSDAIRTYIIRADESLTALGYTEHSFAHVVHVAETAGYILQTLGYDERTVEIAKIAGYLHDIGNLVNRKDHSQSGAVMAWSILNDMGCDPGEIATIVTAIGKMILADLLTDDGSYFIRIIRSFFVVTSLIANG